MSVPNQTPYIIYNANGVTTVFPYEFYIINAGDIQVTINGSVVTSGYSVSGVGNVGGGDVIFLTPPVSGAVIMLERVVPTYRLTDYQDNGDLLADTVNKDFDRLWMAIQRSFIYLGLALRRPLLGGPYNAEGYRITYVADPVNTQDAATKGYVDSHVSLNINRVLRVPETFIDPLPNAAGRANKAVGFDNQGRTRLFTPTADMPGVMLELGSPDGMKNIGACHSMDELRAVVPETNGQHILLRGYYQDIPGDKYATYIWNASSTETDDGGRVVAANSSTTGRWELVQTGNEFDARLFGIRPYAAYSTSMTDSAPMFAKAQASVGTNGVIHFSLPDGWTNAHYLIDADYSYIWSQSWISADPGVVIHNSATNDGEGQKPRLKGDVVFSQKTPTSTTDYTTKRGGNSYDLKSAISAAVATAVSGMSAKTLPMNFTQTARAIKYTNLDVNSSGISYTYDASGMTVQADQIFWSDPGAAGSAAWQGVSFALKTGSEFEVLLENTGSGSAGSIFVGAKMLGSAGSSSTTLGMRMSITVVSSDTDSTNIQFTNGNTIVKTVTVYHPSEILSAGGTNGVRAGVRMLDTRKIGLTLNGKLIHIMSTSSTFVREGIIVMDQNARSTMRIKYGHHKVRKFNPYAMPKTLTCVGDSITRGARSSNEWPRLLEAYAEHMPGIGRIRTLNNVSTSGWRLRDFVINIANYNFTGSEYVLIQLGTNDCQGNVGLTQYYNDIVTFGNKVMADGAFPVFGMFPKYTSSTITGGGNAPVNMQQIAQYQAVLRWACDANGFALAFPDDFFGENYGYLGAFNNADRFSDMWMNDNIHPNTRGQIAIAAAFISALSRELVLPCEASISHLANLTRGVTAYLETTYGLPVVTRIDDTVYITGAVMGGAANASVMAIPEFALPPHQVSATCFSRDAGSLGVCQVYARPNGQLVVGEQYKSTTAGWTEINISYKV
ncbi:phage tail fiber protein [Enterobacter cloacae]|uniref:phage tail fiber domain-containing protein n=1 Tax=Enterobacter cloacae TaxID=550 RepID=UPI00300EC47A